MTEAEPVSETLDFFSKDTTADSVQYIYIYIGLMKHHRPSNATGFYSESNCTSRPCGIVSVLPGKKFKQFLKCGGSSGGMDMCYHLSQLVESHPVF
jgi:hypothetical protein